MAILEMYGDLVFERSSFVRIWRENLFINSKSRRKAMDRKVYFFRSIVYE